MPIRPALPDDTKFAVTLCGAVIVTVVDALALFATFPVQLENAYPLFGVAERFTTVPALKKLPLAGVTVPPAEGDEAVVS